MDMLLSAQLLISALILGSVYALLALGLNLIYGTMRLLNVAHGEVVVLGGYVTFGCAAFGLSPAWGLPASFIAAGLLGLVLYELIFRRLLAKEHLRQRIEANSLLIFFGLSIALQNIGSLAFTADPKSYSFLNQLVSIAGASFDANRLFELGVAAITCITCMLFFAFSSTGLAIRGLMQQRAAAALVGIDAGRLNRIVFVLGFGLAGLAGCLISMTESISPFSGFPYTISAFVVIILGGLGNLAGSLIGGLILAFVEIYGVALTSANWRSIIVYAVFVGMLLLRPQGLFGRSAAA